MYAAPGVGLAAPQVGVGLRLFVFDTTWQPDRPDRHEDHDHAHDHAGHDHAGHDHAGHDHAGHDDARDHAHDHDEGHDHAGHDHHEGHVHGARTGTGLADPDDDDPDDDNLDDEDLDDEEDDDEEPVPRRPFIVANPVLELGPGEQTDQEGCLSVPGLFYSTTRAAAASVRGVDVTGQPVEHSGTGLLARCLQHECDHLAGTLYLDRLTGSARRAAQRTLRESPEPLTRPNDTAAEGFLAALRRQR
jgi:peptide deformylase